MQISLNILLLVSEIAQIYGLLEENSSLLVQNNSQPTEKSSQPNVKTRSGKKFYKKRYVKIIGPGKKRGQKFGKSAKTKGGKIGSIGQFAKNGSSESEKSNSASQSENLELDGGFTSPMSPSSPPDLGPGSSPNKSPSPKKIGKKYVKRKVPMKKFGKKVGKKLRVGQKPGVKKSREKLGQDLLENKEITLKAHRPETVAPKQFEEKPTLNLKKSASSETTVSDQVQEILNTEQMQRFFSGTARKMDYDWISSLLASQDDLPTPVEEDPSQEEDPFYPDFEIDYPTENFSENLRPVLKPKEDIASYSYPFNFQSSLAKSLYTTDLNYEVTLNNRLIKG